MHGLIFKIKESHRQDQSESFVISRDRHTQDMCVCLRAYSLLCFRSQQVKWNHFIMTSVLYMYVYIYMSLWTHICVVSSRRNKTNPHHRNKFIPVLHATLLQACKPKLSTYDQLLKTDQQHVIVSLCVHKLKHFQPHSLLCHLWCLGDLCNSFVCWMWHFYIWWWYVKLTKQLRQTFFFHHIQFISHC